MKVLKLIGQGGFGNVELVEDSTGKQFAQKTFSINQPGNFPAELADNVRKRFIREASVQAALSHPNIMPVLGTSLDTFPPSFLMPVATSTLDKDIQFDKSLGGQQIQAIMDILAGLEELHTIGITHRDLKPQNVLRMDTADGDHYVISDFGLMSIKATQLSVLTQTGMRMGSDYYTAPEIVADLRMASAQSDIYSVGCILHDLFGVSERIPCNEIAENGFYADIIHCCTRQDPKRRFSCVADLRDALLSLGQAGITAQEQQIADLIQLLKSDQPIDNPTWEKITKKAETTYPSNDAKALLESIPLSRINSLAAENPAIGARLGIIYSTWVRESAFNFENCDGIANRLQAFIATNDINCQVDVLIALLLMGTNHNRWYVERLFVSLCGAQMPEPVAKRFAMEVRVMRGKACSAVAHLEKSIGTNRSVLHPIIVDTLNQVC